MLDHLLAAWIGLLRLDALLQEPALGRIEIRAGDDFDIGMVLIAERGTERADALTRDTDADFPSTVRIRLPGEAQVRPALRLVQSLDFRLRRLSRTHRARCGEQRRPHEIAS